MFHRCKRNIDRYDPSSSTRQRKLTWQRREMSGGRRSNSTQPWSATPLHMLPRTRHEPHRTPPACYLMEGAGGQRDMWPEPALACNGSSRKLMGESLVCELNDQQREGRGANRFKDESSNPGCRPEGAGRGGTHARRRGLDQVCLDTYGRLR